MFTDSTLAHFKSDAGLSRYVTPLPTAPALAYRDIRWQGVNSVDPLSERLINYVPGVGGLDIQTLRADGAADRSTLLVGSDPIDYAVRFSDYSLILPEDAKAANPSRLANVMLDLGREKSAEVVQKLHISNETVAEANRLVPVFYQQRIEERARLIEALKHRARVSFWENLGASVATTLLTMGAAWYQNVVMAGSQAAVQGGVAAGESTALSATPAIQAGSTFAAHSSEILPAVPSLAAGFGQSTLAAPLSLLPQTGISSGVGVAVASAAGTLPALPVEVLRLGVGASQINAAIALDTAAAVRSAQEGKQALDAGIKAIPDLQRGRIGSALTTILEGAINIPIRALRDLFNPPRVTGNQLAGGSSSGGGTVDFLPADPASANPWPWVIGSVFLIVLVWAYSRKG